jgi:hypothetical protein
MRQELQLIHGANVGRLKVVERQAG